MINLDELRAAHRAMIDATRADLVKDADPNELAVIAEIDKLVPHAMEIIVAHADAANRGVHNLAYMEAFARIMASMLTSITRNVSINEDRYAEVFNRLTGRIGQLTIERLQGPSDGQVKGMTEQ